MKKYQTKLKPRHFACKTKLFHGSQISSLFFTRTCLGKKLSWKFISCKTATCFDIFHLGIHILGVLFLAKIYIWSCCFSWYIVLESNLQKSSSLSWQLLGSVTLHFAALENSWYQSLRPICKKYINPRKMWGQTKLCGRTFEISEFSCYMTELIKEKSHVSAQNVEELLKFPSFHVTWLN